MLNWSRDLIKFFTYDGRWTSTVVESLVCGGSFRDLKVWRKWRWSSVCESCFNSDLLLVRASISGSSSLIRSSTCFSVEFSISTVSLNSWKFLCLPWIICWTSDSIFRNWAVFNSNSTFRGTTGWSLWSTTLHNWHTKAWSVWQNSSRSCLWFLHILSSRPSIGSTSRCFFRPATLWCGSRWGVAVRGETH